MVAVTPGTTGMGLFITSDTMFSWNQLKATEDGGGGYHGNVYHTLIF